MYAGMDDHYFIVTYTLGGSNSTGRIMVNKIISKIYPFTYLKKLEIFELIKDGKLLRYKKGDLIIVEDYKSQTDNFFFLLEGSVQVFLKNEKIGKITAPAYFGERAIFLGKARKASIVANGQVKCFSVNSEHIISLAKENIYFCQAMASSLQSKHKIFENFDSYINLLKNMRFKKIFEVKEIVKSYQLLSPILHVGCRMKEIDFNALSYVVARLPENVVSMNCLFLSEDLPEFCKMIKKNIQLNSEKSKKVSYFEIMPGKIMTLLRDDLSDYINVLSIFCVYLIETNKIISRLHEHPAILDELSKFYFSMDLKNADDIYKRLPFCKEELDEIKKIFKKDLLRTLYKIIAQNNTIEVIFSQSLVRYHEINSELWTKEIKKLMIRKFSDNIFETDFDIHIISSNTHSVSNCLSTWVHKYSIKMLDLQEYAIFEQSDDNLYAANKDLFEKNTDLEIKRRRIDSQHGIYNLSENYFTGVNVTVIDVNKISNFVDSGLVIKNKNKIIFNIDYAYGKQTEELIFNLILLYGKRIKSISVFGKAGGVNAKRGDILIPKNFILQEDNTVHFLKNDFEKKDLVHLGWKKGVHTGLMLTVFGVLIQSLEMLMFYMNFWHIIGVEMEGSYFVRTINRAKLYGLLNPNISLRFAYYVSDEPLNLSENLSKHLSVKEGIPPVYAITRTILNKIFEDE